ncbi:SRPBCC family protein [Ilumatobacter nonamiensis]|uniref:SRPBCC family protein n=1 Tax=Ilumatobacter nonamiensis TaxID=467093 RepID=UPI00034B39B1|nr:SRPBCC family protein [Ilumatobacter nonamiensis]
MPTHPVHPPEWIDSAPIVVEESIGIDAPPEAVWAEITDHASWPEWFEALDQVEPGSTATGVGGTRRVTAQRLPLDEEFTVWDENEHFAFAITESKLPILGALAESVRLESVDDGASCRVTYRQGVQGRTGFGWAMKLLWSRAAAGLPPALEALKTRVESKTSS